MYQIPRERKASPLGEEIDWRCYVLPRTTSAAPVVTSPPAESISFFCAGQHGHTIRLAEPTRPCFVSVEEALTTRSAGGSYARYHITI